MGKIAPDEYAHFVVWEGRSEYDIVTNIAGISRASCLEQARSHFNVWNDRYPSWDVAKRRGAKIKKFRIIEV